MICVRDPCGAYLHQNQLLDMWMTPYKTQDYVYEWVEFSKFSQIWARIGSNLRKFWKNWTILLKIWLICMIGSLLLEKLVFVWVYFQISWQHIPTKTKLEYLANSPPLPAGNRIDQEVHWSQSNKLVQCPFWSWLESCTLLILYNVPPSDITQTWGLRS